ncbi:MAG: hypothetical protein GXP49_17030 [Deltaproteobacteria bacterium]|nr:hypothetical protein [Deltaproteobacteria bacterium]
MSIECFDVLLLLALPASGKSELRKYMDSLEEDRRKRELHLFPTLQLDDFPYVHLIQVMDQKLEDLGTGRCFFKGAGRPAREPSFWGLLTELLNQDFNALSKGVFPPAGPGAGRRLLDRIEQGYEQIRVESPLTRLDSSARKAAIEAIDQEAWALERDLASMINEKTDHSTIVIEFARGGPKGSRMPLDGYLGYQYSLSHLAPELLSRASILYVWVTPEESRRKNMERANPDEPGSILHHGVPEEVMLQDYGCDDMDHLLAGSSHPGTVEVEAKGQKIYIPAERFDNRSDMTSFLRNDPNNWDRSRLAKLHTELSASMQKLFHTYINLGK